MSLEGRKDPLFSNRQLPLDSEEYDGFLFSALCHLQGMKKSTEEQSLVAVHAPTVNKRRWTGT